VKRKPPPQQPRPRRYRLHAHPPLMRRQAFRKSAAQRCERGGTRGGAAAAVICAAVLARQRRSSRLLFCRSRCENRQRATIMMPLAVLPLHRVIFRRSIFQRCTATSSQSAAQTPDARQVTASGVAATRHQISRRFSAVEAPSSKEAQACAAALTQTSKERRVFAGGAANAFRAPVFT